VTKYGIAIAQSGTPIDRASDYQKIIDTRWKTASIIASIPYRNEDLEYGPEFVKIFDHNLGYIPAFEAPFYNTTYESQSSLSGSYLFVADSTSIWFVNGVHNSTPSASPTVIDGVINVYDVNIEVDFTSTRNGLVAAPRSSDRGVKLIGNGKYAAHDANDSDPLGFSLSTDAKGIGIAEIGTVHARGGDPVGFTVLNRGIIRHDLPYPPLLKLVDSTPYENNFLVQNKPPSATGKFYGPMRLLGSSGVRVEPGQLVIRTGYPDDDRYRYIIFRDPVDIAV